MEERKNWKFPVILVAILLLAAVGAWVGISLFLESFRTTQLNGIYHQYEKGREYTKEEFDTVTYMKWEQIPGG